VKRWLGAAVLFLVSLSGCASSSHAATDNPCAYVSSADVTPIVGGPVEPGLVTTDMGPKPGNAAVSCLFEHQGSFVIPVSGSNADVQFALVSFIDQPTYDMWQGNQDQTVHIHPVSGFGDHAFEAGGVHFDILFVARGAYRLIFEVAAGLTSFLRPAEQLARVVIPRLPAS
jgi:hypothetical protein